MNSCNECVDEQLKSILSLFDLELIHGYRIER